MCVLFKADELVPHLTDFTDRVVVFPIEVEVGSGADIIEDWNRVEIVQRSLRSSANLGELSSISPPL